MVKSRNKLSQEDPGLNLTSALFRQRDLGKVA